MGNFCNIPEQLINYPSNRTPNTNTAEQTVLVNQHSRNAYSSFKGISVAPENRIKEQSHSDDQQLQLSVIQQRKALGREAKQFFDVHFEKGYILSRNHLYRMDRQKIIQYKNIFLEAKWINLASLGISSEPVGNKGCRYLSTALMPQLSKLGLVNCSIQQPGICHLSKKPWKKLTQLYLTSNKIANSLYHFSKMQLPSKAYINLENNRIAQQEIDFLLISSIISIQINLSFSYQAWNKFENIKKKEKKIEQAYKKFRSPTYVII